MNGGIKWKSTSRQLQIAGTTLVEILQRRRGQDRVVWTPRKELDRPSLIVMGTLSLFAFVILLAVDLPYAILWLFAAGPMSLLVVAMIARMGGVVWCRLVATGYTGILLIGLGCVMGVCG